MAKYTWTLPTVPSGGGTTITGYIRIQSAYQWPKGANVDTGGNNPQPPSFEDRATSGTNIGYRTYITANSGGWYVIQLKKTFPKGSTLKVTGLQSGQYSGVDAGCCLKCDGSTTPVFHLRYGTDNSSNYTDIVGSKIKRGINSSYPRRFYTTSNGSSISTGTVSFTTSRDCSGFWIRASNNGDQLWGGFKLQLEYGGYDLTLSRNIAEAGTVTGGGTALIEGAKTVTATTTDDKYEFVGWYDITSSTEGTEVSKNASFSYNLTKDTKLEARWKLKYVPPKEFTITVTKNTDVAGEAYGSGTYLESTEINLVSTTTNKNYIFIGWYKDDKLVSSDDIYKIIVTKSETYEARWLEKDAVWLNFVIPLHKKVTVNHIQNSIGFIDFDSIEYKEGSWTGYKQHNFQSGRDKWVFFNHTVNGLYDEIDLNYYKSCNSGRDNVHRISIAENSMAEYPYAINKTCGITGSGWKIGDITDLYECDGPNISSWRYLNPRTETVDAPYNALSLNQIFAQENPSTPTTGNNMIIYPYWGRDHANFQLPVKAGQKLLWNRDSDDSTATPIIYTEFNTFYNSYIGTIKRNGKKSKGFLVQNESNATNNDPIWVEAKYDCWLYCDVTHTALSFRNSSNSTTIASPFLINRSDVIGKFITNNSYYNTHSISIPLRKGQQFCLLPIDSNSTWFDHKVTGTTIEYKLYEMSTDIRSAVKWIDFKQPLEGPIYNFTTYGSSTKALQHIVELPDKIITRVGTGGDYYFKYTAPENCWVYLTCTSNDCWNMYFEDSIILSPILGGYNYNPTSQPTSRTATTSLAYRYGKYFPLVKNGSFILKFGSVTTSSNDWASSYDTKDVKFAVYKMME